MIQELENSSEEDFSKILDKGLQINKTSDMGSGSEESESPGEIAPA